LRAPRLSDFLDAQLAADDDAADAALRGELRALR